MKFFERAVFEEEHEIQLIKNFFGNTPNVFVDVGGNLPENSISTPLELCGWTGLVVEPQPDCCDALRAKRNSPIFQCACVSQKQIDDGINVIRLFLAGPQSSTNFNFISPRDRTETFIEVPARTLNQVLEEAGLSKIDLLSLDTEGTEVDVMQGLDWQKFSPKLVLLEDHARNFYKHNFMKSLGYKLFRRTGFNSWYARECDALPISLFGYLQIFRKYVLGLPGRNFRIWRQKKFS